MDYEVAKAKGGQAVTTAIVEGGAVVAGMFGAGFVGKQVENFAKKGVTKTSTLTDKVIAYVANNAPKAALWYVVKEYVEPKGGVDASKDFGKMFYVDARKGAMASIALDTVMRLSNDLAPVKFPQLFGIDMMGNTGTSQTGGNTQALQSNLQRMVQENSSLRSQLNSAMTKLASAPTVNVQELRPPEPHDTRFGMMQTTPEAENRRRNFGAMAAPPIQEERNRRFGAMDKKSLNFAGEESSVAAMYGML